MEEQKIYFVIDMKTFFASVECAERNLNPFETNLVVADEKRSKGTVCLAITPKMKALGIRNRCRLYEIPQNIDFIIAKPRMKKYIEYAANIYEIYLQYIDKNDIHIYSIDECFIDATSYIKFYKTTPKAFAQKLMNEIKEKLKIPSTCGIGTNMFLAKIALDLTAKKTKDGIGFLDETKFRKELWTHRPITDFWQISTGIANRLERYGIYDMKGITEIQEDFLYKEFGVNAELLIDHAFGKETCEISDIKKYKSKSKSFGSSQILPCNYSYIDSIIILKEMLQNGCYDLVKNGYVAQGLYISIGYGDSKQNETHGTIKLGALTNLYSIVEEKALLLFDKIVNKEIPIRKIGFTFTNLLPEENESYDLLTDLRKVKKEKNLTKSVISIQNKFGKNSLLKGIDLNEKATQKERNNMIGGHNGWKGKNVKRDESKTIYAVWFIKRSSRGASRKRNWTWKQS